MGHTSPCCLFCCLLCLLLPWQSPDLRTLSTASTPDKESFRGRPHSRHQADSFCGASIVSDRWLVTAAHCVQGKYPSRVKVVLGLHDQKKTYGSPATYRISQIISHNRYDSRTISNDIALLQTSSSIRFTKGISKIRLPSQGQTFVGQRCQISGWGRLCWHASGANILQKLDVDVISSSRCSIRGDAGKVCIKPSSGRAASACKGDSGGPLACNGVLVGAASYVFGQCSTSSPNVYASTAHYRGWIRQYTGI